jgi:hypothetical protein
LGSSPNNPYALLDIVDCTSEMAKGGKKDAKYIAGLLKPIISWIEETKDPNNQKTDHRGVVDLLLFDGASNVQNAAKLVSITYPRITVQDWWCPSTLTSKLVQWQNLAAKQDTRKSHGHQTIRCNET